MANEKNAITVSDSTTRRLVVIREPDLDEGGERIVCQFYTHEQKSPTGEVEITGVEVLCWYDRKEPATKVKPSELIAIADYLRARGANLQ